MKPAVVVPAMPTAQSNARIDRSHKEAGDAVKKREKLVNMMKDDRLVFRTPTFILDHRKLYILKSDDGRTRVITSSANMSYDAWNNSQIELYEYDDTEKAYDEYKALSRTKADYIHTKPYIFPLAVFPNNAINKSVTWKSFNEQVCMVSDEGLVTATGIGSTIVTVTTKDGGKSDFCIVKVGGDGIMEIQWNSTDTAPVYDVMGRRVNTLTRGQLYISNGNKFICR